MAAPSGSFSPALPRLLGRRLTVRPGTPDDAAVLRDILSEASVAQWWGEPEPEEAIAAELRGEAEELLLVIEVDGAVAGGIQYVEETEPMYRHASIDIFLGTRRQRQGLGTEAITLMVDFLFHERHHHRLTIDPALANHGAIGCYSAVGFRPVGVMRQYERGPDGTWHDSLLMDLLASDLERPSPA